MDDHVGNTFRGCLVEGDMFKYQVDACTCMLQGRAIAIYEGHISDHRAQLRKRHVSGALTGPKSTPHEFAVRALHNSSPITHLLCTVPLLLYCGCKFLVFS